MNDSESLAFWSGDDGLFTTTTSFGAAWSNATAVDLARTIVETTAVQRSRNRELNCKTFTFVVYVVLFGSIVVFGLIGNTLSFVVLQFDRHSHAATFLLQVDQIVFLCVLMLCAILFHDLLLRSCIYHCVWSVITAHNLTPEKRDNNYSPHPLIPISCLRNNIQLITGICPCCGCL